MPAYGPEGYSMICIKINKWCIEDLLKAQSSLQMLNGKCKFITHLILPQFSPQIERVPLSPFCVQLFPYLFHLFSRDALRSTGDKSLMDACLDFVWQCFIPLFPLKKKFYIWYQRVFFPLLCHCWSSWCGVCWYILVRLAVFYGQLLLLSCWTSVQQGQPRGGWTCSWGQEPSQSSSSVVRHSRKSKAKAHDTGLKGYPLLLHQAQQSHGNRLTSLAQLAISEV